MLISQEISNLPVPYTLDIVLPCIIHAHDEFAPYTVLFLSWQPFCDYTCKYSIFVFTIYAYNPKNYNPYTANMAYKMVIGFQLMAENYGAAHTLLQLINH